MIAKYFLYNDVYKNNILTKLSKCAILALWHTYILLNSKTPPNKLSPDFQGMLLLEVPTARLNVFGYFLNDYYFLGQFLKHKLILRSYG